ncbi:MAG TPA: class I SAM-dependent methyltransferase [Xanthomonadales bacterium]|nr:class I SAM-dependent methyltransferase [Xanthomonadales bacterium]
MTREASDNLEFTGERFTPECVREIWYEHMHRYVLAGELVQGKSVLDAACGEGYGAHYLAGKALAVTAVDVSPRTVAHATARYQAPNLSYQVADCRRLPFADGQFTCIVSFETLEHLQDQEALLREFRRVLSADGFLVLSSPDKAVYSDQLHNENPWHLRELYRHELESLLAGEFPAVKLLGQKLAFHSMIWKLGTRQGPSASAGNSVTFHREQNGASVHSAVPAADAVYFIALCAAEERFLPPLQNHLWLFDDAAESVYQHYLHEIRRNMQAGGILAAREREIEALKAALQETNGRPAHGPVPRRWWRRLLGGS